MMNKIFSLLYPKQSCVLCLRVNVSSNILNDEEDIALPCEFCGNSFPADQLVQHEVM